MCTSSSASVAFEWLMSASECKRTGQEQVPMLQSERRTYRKSPGRQYAYDYDPLRSRPRTSSNASRTGPASQQTTKSGADSRHTSGILAPRPDPRRTRQLLRQNILATKARATMVLEPEEMEGEVDETPRRSGSQQHHGQRQPAPQQSRGQDEGRPQSRMLQPYHPQPPAPVAAPRTRRLAELHPADEEALVEWEPQGVDPDLGYEYEEEEDPLDRRLAPAATVTPRRRAGRPAHRGPAPAYEDEEEEPERKPRRKKKGVTRRKLLWGLGLAAVGGGTIAAIELGPKLPQAVENAGNNIEKQLEEQFQKGVQAGADQVRREFITALDSMEGVSLDAAIAAARLTRVAYDVFVSPLVTLAATVAGDFLNVTLSAVITARGWLARIYQDNDTLAALQNVLQSWVNDVNKMPRQLQTITDTDLDGAQAYLRAVQRKLQQEQALLNQSTKATPTPTARPGAKPTATPGKH